ncbi:ABC transporter ATP-binding protein [Clostridium hydrogenum]|uniref:ABC transporter ATP-binding protein n=1 Tax=Clostridium hydrogenum TaxID=2855764 RepID=UPI001F37B6F3|nr:ATP-binding cassette domain-containing protein [Clostridium hydrogenum]
MEQIILKDVYKQYKVAKKKKGLIGAFSNLFHSEKILVNAVNGISFTINQGEIVGYIGPNGAGKSTTIKMMSGILHPTSGEILINGISPQNDRKKVVKNLGVVFGQRSQLYWDLRLGESFELLKRIYRVNEKQYKDYLSEMREIMDLNKFIDIPVRQLSLGQRMRGELVAAMIHSPSILFLDEPTIGLDIDAKRAIRKFILEINKRKGVTVILTTHDLEDVSELCKRLIVINHGNVVEDGPIDEIISKMAEHRMMVLELASPITCLKTNKAKLVKVEGNKIWCKFDHHKITASELISELAKELSIIDLSVKEPDIEDAISQIYHAK